MMRIVAGKYGGRKLQVPKSRDIRPTSDKVRGAVFNVLQSRGVVEGARVLDCFCGTGALGLEALSRRAARCTFIDKSRTSLELAKENAKTIGAENVDFMLKDASKLGVRLDDTPSVNLVFLDPPYEQGLLIPTLFVLHNQLWMESEATVIAEVEKSFGVGGDVNSTIPAPYKLLDERTYGDTKIIFLSYQSAPE